MFIYTNTFCNICIQSKFDLPHDDDKYKKAWLKGAGRYWKDFKSDLSVTYIYADGDQDGNKTPVGVYPAISEEIWQRFRNSRMDPQFLVSSNFVQ